MQAPQAPQPFQPSNPSMQPQTPTAPGFSPAPASASPNPSTQPQTPTVPGFSPASPVQPTQTTQTTQTMQAIATVPGGGSSRGTLDFSAGQGVSLPSTESGNKLMDGTYIYVISSIVHRVSGNPQMPAGTNVTAIKGCVASQLDPNSQDVPGSMRDIVKTSSSLIGYYSTFLGLLACFRGQGETAKTLQDNQMVGLMQNLVTLADSTSGVAVVVRCKTVQGRNDPYQIYDFERVLSDEELYGYLQQQDPAISDLCLPQGYRTTRGLSPVAAYFQQVQQ